MARIERFEDIKAWQLAKELVVEVYKVSARDPFVKDFGLREQIRRAAVSIMANIAEGFERESDKEFQRFLVIDKGSAGEVRSHLYVASELGYVSAGEFERLKQMSEETSKAIQGFIAYLQGQ